MFQGGRWRLLMADQLLRDRAVREWRLSGQQIVERAAQAVNVGADISAMKVKRLFGSHVIGRPHHHQRSLRREQAGCLGWGQIVRAINRGTSVQASQAQIEKLDRAAAIDDQVWWLD